MLGGANANTRAGVIAFPNPVSVSDPSLPLVPAALTGWDRDLVMTAVPEPGTFALAGLGAGVLLDLRRRQRRQCRGANNEANQHLTRQCIRPWLGHLAQA